MKAARNGHKDTVQLLVDLGADVDKAANNGGTGAWEEGDGGPGRGAHAADTEAGQHSLGLLVGTRTLCGCSQISART